MINRRGVSALIAVLLLLMMTITASSAMFYWLIGVQASSQEKALAHERSTLRQIITAADLSIAPDYSAEEEALLLNLSELRITIENKGKLPLELGEGDITFNLRKPDGTVVCNTNVSTKEICLEEEFYMLAGGRPHPDYIGSSGFPSNVYFFSNSNLTKVATPEASSPVAFKNYSRENEAVNIYASTEAACDCASPEGFVMWAEYGRDWDYTPALGGDLLQFLAIEEYNGSLYAGGYDFNRNALLLNSTNALDWTLTYNFSEYRKVTALKTFQNRLYVGLGDRTGNGSIYSTGDLVTWTNETISGPGTLSAILSFGEFNGSIFAGTGQKFSGNSNFPSSGGKGYILTKNSAGTWVINATTNEIPTKMNVTDFVAFNKSFYAGSYQGTATNGTLFEYNGTNWTIHSRLTMFPEGTGFFALANWNDTELYAGVGSTQPALGSGMYHYNSELPAPDNWVIVYSNSTEWFVALDAFKKCDKKEILCYSGCDATIQPTERRELRFSMEDSECDIDGDGPGTDYTASIYFGTDFSLTFPFEKSQETFNDTSVDV